jgi:hypothetical protein
VSSSSNISAIIIIKSRTHGAMLHIALFHNENGCLIDAPYLDSYGQVLVILIYID